MEFLYRVKIEPAAATEPVFLAAPVPCNGYEVSFDGALVLRRRAGTSESLVRLVDGAETVVQRFVTLLSVRTGLPAAADTRTYCCCGGNVVQCNPGVAASLEYELEPEPWTQEVAWALEHLPLLDSPLVRMAIEHCQVALLADEPHEEAAGFYHFGLMLADALRGQEAEYGALLGMDAGTFRRWLAVLDQARRGRLGTLGLGLRGRLVAQELLLAMANWAPRLQAPVAVGME